jgi:hypothetical protein
MDHSGEEEPASPDGITCSLALHYVADLRVPLRSFASALRAAGLAVISLDHPLGPPLRASREATLTPSLLSDTWHQGGVEASRQFCRTPLEPSSAHSPTSGSSWAAVVEPQPSHEALRLFPDDLTGIVGVPVFVCSAPPSGPPR